MDIFVAMAYKKECFAGKGVAARMLDRVFLALLASVGIYVLLRGKPWRGVLALCTGVCTLALLILLDERRFQRYMQEKERAVEERLRILRFIKRGGEGSLSEGEEAVFSLEPLTVREMQTRCLEKPGRIFRLYQQEDAELMQAAEELGCKVRFCSEALAQVQVEKQEVMNWLVDHAPKRKRFGRAWGKLIKISGKRFLLAGGLLTLFSFFLPYSLFFRLLGTAAFAYGGVSLGMSILRKV